MRSRELQILTACSVLGIATLATEMDGSPRKARHPAREGPSPLLPVPPKQIGKRARRRQCGKLLARKD